MIDNNGEIISGSYWFLAEKAHHLGDGCAIQITPTQWKSSPKFFDSLPKTLSCPCCRYTFEVQKIYHENTQTTISTDFVIPCMSPYSRQHDRCQTLYVLK